MNRFVLMMCAAAAYAPAFADEELDHRFYAAATIGRAFGDVDAMDMNNRMLQLGYAANAQVRDQNRNSWGAAFGYRINHYLDVELGYTDLGKVRTRLAGSATDINDYLNSANLVHPRSADGISLALRGRYYVADDFFLFAKAGVLWADSEYIATAPDAQRARERSENPLFFGVGGEYEINSRWGCNLTGGIHRIEDESITSVAIGISYKFGREFSQK